MLIGVMFRCLQYQFSMSNFDTISQETECRFLAGNVYGALRLVEGAEGIPPCGQLLRIGDPATGCFATLGGLIKVSWGASSRIFGLTVRRVCEKGLTDASGKNLPVDLHDRYDPGCITQSSGPAKILDNQIAVAYSIDSKVDVAASSCTCLSSQEISQSKETERGLLLCCIGSIVQNLNTKRAVPANETKDNYRNSQSDSQVLNWALVRITDVSKYEVNIARGLDTTRHLISASRSEYGRGLGKAVVVLSGLSGSRLGMLANTLACPDVYLLQLSNHNELQSGDCGSWVADILTGEVYGQVTTLGNFGTAYVAAFGSIMDAVKTELQAESITFPTNTDLEIHEYDEQVREDDAVSVSKSREAQIDCNDDFDVDAEEVLIIPNQSSHCVSRPQRLIPINTTIDIDPVKYQDHLMTPPESPSGYRDDDDDDHDFQHPSSTGRTFNFDDSSTIPFLLPPSAKISSTTPSISCMFKVRAEPDLLRPTTHTIAETDDGDQDGDGDEDEDEDEDNPCITCPVPACPQSSPGSMSSDLGDFAQHLRFKHSWDIQSITEQVRSRM